MNLESLVAFDASLMFLFLLNSDLNSLVNSKRHAWDASHATKYHRKSSGSTFSSHRNEFRIPDFLVEFRP